MEQIGLDFAAQAERKVFTVEEITAAVRDLIEGEFFDIRIEGEVSNTRRASSGHFYFTLKDDKAQIRCVCFRQNALYLKLKPEDGLQVTARGHISVYEARGEYQLYVESLEPRGIGALQIAFERLKKKLDEEGLFDLDRKRPLPMFPRRIGLVTSPTGAAVADIIRVIERRFRGLAITLYPVRVQGQGAAGDIVRALDYFSAERSVDVLIVGRGGGSLEDLWPFNEEAVARAVARCAVPVISAVGHQTDFTIADFVADARAATPSAAAEMVIRPKRDFEAVVFGLSEQLVQSMRLRIALLDRSAHRLGLERSAGLLRRRISGDWQKSDEYGFRLRQAMAVRFRSAENRLRAADALLPARDPRLLMTAARSRLDGLRARIVPAVQRSLERNKAVLDALDRQAAGLSPLHVLERGYAIVSDSAGAALRDSANVEIGDALRVRLHRGGLGVRVETKDPGN